MCDSTDVTERARYKLIRTIFPSATLPAPLLTLEQGFAPVHAITPQRSLPLVKPSLLRSCCSAYGLNGSTSGERLVIQGYRKSNSRCAHDLSGGRNGHRAHSCSRLLGPCLDINRLRRSGLLRELVDDCHCGDMLGYAIARGMMSGQGKKRCQKSNRRALQMLYDPRPWRKEGE